jgi:hypothetical protein
MHTHQVGTARFGTKRTAMLTMPIGDTYAPTATPPK